MATERAVTTSISLFPTKLDKLEIKAAEKGFKSRNSLIDHILTAWLEKEAEKDKRRKAQS